MDFYWLMLLISNTSSLLLHFRQNFTPSDAELIAKLHFSKMCSSHAFLRGSCLVWRLMMFAVLWGFFFLLFFFKIFLFGFDLVLVCFLLFCCLLLDILIVSFSLYSHAQHTTKRRVRSGRCSWTLGWQHIITLCSVRVSVWCARVCVK